MKNYSIEIHQCCGIVIIHLFIAESCNIVYAVYATIFLSIHLLLEVGAVSSFYKKTPVNICV